ncbi:hypothetical protein N0V84_010216 [Fusarium piperis]|uniref:Bacteriophage T5 Orf172 DNA-binding domain-containing protein n=1 Tax=Fusarium piperis TaxID=1435070 RepID=A0A9W8W4V4_9HYPO|nr:hypothetical protein N0V84_010216 [Fusarium piperis]
MVHNHLVHRGHHSYGKHEYVALVLGERLSHWDGDTDDETPESTRSNTPTRHLQYRTQAESSDDEHEYVEDGDEDYDEEYWEDGYKDEEDEDEDEDGDDEDGDEESDNDNEDEEDSEEGSEEDNEAVTAKKSTMSCRQRPKLNRESAMINKSAFVTPTKQRGRPRRNSRPSTPRMEHVVDDFGSLSIIDDASASSPESVISPGVSDVFSPVSIARRRCLSLTRTLSWTFKDGNGSTTTKKKSSRKGNKQLEQDQDSDSERPTDNEEEFEEQPTSEGGKTSLSPELRKMTFTSSKSDQKGKCQLKLLLKRLHTTLIGKSLAPGWVYCFAEKTAPGYLKIGCRQYRGKNGKPTLDEKDATQVIKRLWEWERKCKHDIVYKFIYFMPCAADTMERLVHRTLHKSNRKARCPNPACKTTHVEWFEISEMEARRAVEVWQQFSEFMPYANQGRLGNFWHNHTYGDYKYCDKWSIEKWMHERWTKVIIPAAVERDKRINELEEKKAQLAKRRREALERRREALERRKEALERRKELELEIKGLKQEGEKIQGELTELQSQR